MPRIPAGFILLLFPLFSNGERFILTSDEPGIIGSNVTFYAHLENPLRDPYTIVWQENYPNSRLMKAVLDKESDYRSNWTLKYERPGNFTLTVIVTYTFLFVEIPIFSELYNYEITENFTGKLEISQAGVPRKEWDVSTLNETLISVHVHDPSNYLGTASNVTYTWFQNQTLIANTTSPSLRLNFTKEYVYPFLVNLTATFPGPNGTFLNKYGSFTHNISAKVPIVNFKIQGATWFRHGNLLDLTVTCDGTPPFEYCWIFKYGPYNKTGNETCEMAMTSDCTLHISRYFESGTYNLILLLNNDVARVLNQTGIHVYKTTTKPQLSIIIVPITFTCFALILIIFGVAYYWENQVQYTVEVADFDFGQTEGSPYVRFLDRLRDAVSSSVNLRGRRGSVLLPPDNESIVSS